MGPVTRSAKRKAKNKPDDNGSDEKGTNSLIGANRGTKKAKKENDKNVQTFETYEMRHVIVIPPDLPPKEHRNKLKITLMQLANIVSVIKLPTARWSSKVLLYEMYPNQYENRNFEIYNGDLTQYRLDEADRHKFYPSAVIFRQLEVDRRRITTLCPRALLFRNDTFYIHMKGKMVKLVGAPTEIETKQEVETVLEILDTLTIESSLVEILPWKGPI